MIDTRSLAQLAYEDYVRKSGLESVAKPWGNLEPRTRAYWQAKVQQEARRKAEEMFAAAHGPWFVGKPSYAAWADLATSTVRAQWLLAARKAIRADFAWRESSD